MNPCKSDKTIYIDKQISYDGYIERRIHSAEIQDDIDYILGIRKCPECKAELCTSVSGRNRKELKYTCPYCFHIVYYEEDVAS